jgi:hypothetical protein
LGLFDVVDAIQMELLDPIDVVGTCFKELGGLFDVVDTTQKEFLNPLDAVDGSFGDSKTGPERLLTIQNEHFMQETLKLPEICQFRSGYSLEAAVGKGREWRLRAHRQF